MVMTRDNVDHKILEQNMQITQILENAIRMVSSEIKCTITQCQAYWVYICDGNMFYSCEKHAHVCVDHAYKLTSSINNRWN